MADLKGKSKKTLDALFAHPIATNLDWKDVLTLIQRFGSIEHHRHGNLHVDITDHRLTFKHTNEKQLDKDQVAQLRTFLKDLGITPEHPNLDQHALTYEHPPMVVVIAHHEADIWHQDAAGAKLHEDKKLHPHDPHHFRHHLKHKNEDHLKGQRASEDVEFYKTLVKELEHAPQAIVIGDATGNSSAMGVFRKYLTAHHKALLQRVSAFVDADLSALTEPQIREIASRYWS